MQITQQHHLGGMAGKVEWTGEVFMPKRDLQRVLSRPGDYIDGWEIQEQKDRLLLLPKPNLVVDVGVARSLDRLYSISGGSGPAPLDSLTKQIVRLGVDNGTTNPVAASVSSNNGSGADTGSSTQTLRTFNSAATRASLVVSATGTFNDAATTGGIGAVGFAMKRLFLSAHAANITNTTSADTDGTLYSMTNVFTVDFTSIAIWAANFTATVTGAGS